MNRMHDNSLAAYEAIAESLPSARALVYRAIAARPGLTRNQIAERLNIPINRVTGRIREMIDMKIIQESSSVEGPEGKLRSTLILRNNDE